MIRNALKPAVSDPKRVGAASLIYRSGVAEQFRWPHSYPTKFSELRFAASRLLEAGVIDYEQHDEILRAINRRAAADFLRRFRKAEPFERRLALIRKLRAAVPIGLSPYAIRMSHHLKSRRLDLA